jgi:hypothetical protein
VVTLTATTYFNTVAQIVVGSGGTLTAAGSTFNSAIANGGTTRVLNGNGGYLTASGCSFYLSQITLDPGSIAILTGGIVSALFTINSEASVSISGNDFSLLGENAVVATGDPNSTIDLTYNDWGTAVPDEIARKILDHHQNPTTRPTVLYTPFLARIRFTNHQGDNDWNNPMNWDLHRVPAAGDTVLLDLPDLTLTFSSGSATVAALTLSGSRSTLRVQGGTLQVNGALQVSGPDSTHQPTLIVDGGTLDGETVFDVNTATLTVNGGVVRAPYGVSVRGGSTFNFNNGTVPATTLVNATLNLGPSATAAATFVCQGSCTLNGNIAAGQTVVVQGSNVGRHALLTIPAGLTNAGTLRLETVEGNWDSGVTVSAGSLTNAAGGVIAVNPGTGGGRSLAGELINAGTVAVSGTTLALGRAGANHVNTGRLQLISAGLAVTGDTFVNQSSGVISGDGSTDTIDARNDPLNNLGLLDVLPGASLVVTGSLRNFNPTLHTLSGGSYHVAGTLGLDGGNLTSLGADLELTNLGSRVVNNQGGGDALAGLAAITAAGTLALRNQNLTLAGPFADAGTLSVSDSATLTVNGAYSQTGTMQIFDAGTVLLNGAFTNFNTTTNTLTGGTYVITGAAGLPSTLLFGNANLQTNAATIVLDGPSAAITDLAGNNALAGFAANNGSFTIRNSQNLSLSGPFTNAGTLTIGANSTWTVNGAYTQTAGRTVLYPSGTLVATGGVTVAQGSVLDGSGTITGNVTNAGTINAGGVGAVGTLTVTGNLTTTGSLVFALGGHNPGIDFDWLSVSGQVSLGGALQVSLVNGFTPSHPDSFRIMTFAGVTGSFASSSLPPGGSITGPFDGTVNF